MREPFTSSSVSGSTSANARCFRVRLDIEAIVRNISREDQKPTLLAEVIRFLEASGFVADGDYWIVAEPNLSVLQPQEVLEAQPIPSEKPDR